MATTATWYGLGLLWLLETPGDLEALTLKLALVTDSYTPNRDTDDFRNDFTAAEVPNGNGYSTGGVTLTGVALTYDSASDQVRLDFDDVGWTFLASKTWRYASLFVETVGGDSADPVIGLITWDANQTVSGVYSLQLDAAGLLYLDTTP